MRIVRTHVIVLPLLLLCPLWVKEKQRREMTMRSEIHFTGIQTISSGKEIPLWAGLLYGMKIATVRLKPDAPLRISKLMTQLKRGGEGSGGRQQCTAVLSPRIQSQYDGITVWLVLETTVQA
jgi:hypothetical protein